ncbi:hypothetical protein MRBLWO14_001054 [Microbacterium sp. LWO14-1.2]|uniref:hypothetical protein n=1 Tax=Microbacterium sp. LWO14-1.2 TaxID=3135263 RepID=UPI003139578E
MQTTAHRTVRNDPHVNTVLLSVKPQFARRLLSGHKTAEVRRRFPTLAHGTAVYLYASSPLRAIIGVLHIEAVRTGAPEVLWPRYGDQLDITEEYFLEYLGDRGTASVVELRVDERWDRPVSLESMREFAALEPPQSYRYLSADQQDILRSLSRAI